MRNDRTKKRIGFAGTGGMKIAAAGTAVMCLVVWVLRTLLAPYMQDVQTGAFHPSYAVILVMLLTLLAVGVLSFLSPSVPARPAGKWLMPTAIMGILAGAVLTLTSLFDAVLWFGWNQTPPPNEIVISTIDGVTLFFSILFGLLGGIMLVRLGLVWLSEQESRAGILRWWALAPVGWIWMRLARYEVSYASAVDVSQSFYDFVMLIFTLLFLFSLARYVSGVGQRKPRLLFFLALATALCSLSGPLTRLALYLLGQFDAYNASPLAGVADGFIGGFALVFAFSLAFWNGETSPAGDVPAGDESAKAAAPSVDDILRELYPKDE